MYFTAVKSFITLAIVIAIENYDRKTFIVQATEWNTFQVLPSRVGSWTYSHTLDKAECHCRALQLIVASVSRRKVL